jgi:hypothetical protein
MTSLKSAETKDFHLFLSVDSMNQGPDFSEITVLQVRPSSQRRMSAYYFTVYSMWGSIEI